MIAITLAACLTVFLLGVIKIMADRPRLPPPPSDPTAHIRATYAEERRVLERERAMWLDALRPANLTIKERIALSEEITKSDRRLEALARKEREELLAHSEITDGAEREE